MGEQGASVRVGGTQLADSGGPEVLTQQEQEERALPGNLGTHFLRLVSMAALMFREEATHVRFAGTNTLCAEGRRAPLSVQFGDCPGPAGWANTQ